MTSSLRPEGGSPPTQGQPVDPLAEWLTDLSPSPRPDFQASLRSRVLDLPPSAGHWILRLPGRKPLYLPTLPTAMSLLVLGAVLLAAGWMLLDGSRLITSSEQAPETVKPMKIVPAIQVEVDLETPSEAADDDATNSDASGSDDSAQDVEDSTGETTSDSAGGTPDAEQPVRLPTATAPPTELPPATATSAPPPTATATEPPPPPPPPSGDDDDDDDDDPPTATPEPPTATATWRPPAEPEPIPSATMIPTRDLPTTVPPTEIPPSPSPTPANP